MPESDCKNSLTIRLAESVVFLTPTEHSDPASGSRNAPQADAPNNSHPSMLRGLLTLNLAKPMRISSIELEFQGKVYIAWPEGVGHRRIDVTHEHKLYSASTVFFHADPHPSSRRATSLGPDLYDCEEAAAEWEVHSGSYTPRCNEDHSRVRDLVVPPRVARRVSADSSVFQSNYQSYRISLPPTPTYMERPDSSYFLLSPPADESIHEDPAQTLEDLRQALHADLGVQRSPSRGRNTNLLDSSLNCSSASSARSPSLRPPIEDASENDLESDANSNHSNETSRSRWHSSDHSSQSPTDRRNESRRRSSQFLTVPNAIFSAVKDRVRSRSPRTDADSERVRGRSSDRSEDGQVRSSLSRGRALEKGNITVKQQQQQQQPRKERFSIPRFGEFLKSDGDDSEKRKEVGDGWKEFKKGTYTYPISFPIPGDSPPSMQCQGGAVTWRLKASVHRPGAFTSKLSAIRDVTLISGPRGDHTEDIENLLIERHWESQLQYLISISGRAFYIGGTLPIQFALMPLAKVKVHRISVTLEEKIDYYIQQKCLARRDPIKLFSLLNLKYADKLGLPILPLESDDVDAFKNSPLYALCAPGDDPSEMASSLMGPGPWMFQHELPLPSSCASVHPTNTNRKSDIIIHHVIRIVIRIERGDDMCLDATGKRKLFDIVLQFPVHILSCRCNPEWTSLPQYSQGLEGGSADSQHCPCHLKRIKSARRSSFVLGRTEARESGTSTEPATTVETSAVNPVTMPSLWALNTLRDRNTQFERLVSGQESEVGEAPPSYDDIPGSTSTRAH